MTKGLTRRQLILTDINELLGELCDNAFDRGGFVSRKAREKQRNEMLPKYAAELELRHQQMILREGELKHKIWDSIAALGGLDINLES
jgi:hypothetical protein